MNAKLHQRAVLGNTHLFSDQDGDEIGMDREQPILDREITLFSVALSTLPEINAHMCA